MQRLHDEKRDRILDAAASLFAARPFHKVLLQDVAVEAGVGKGSLYTYFENKDALYLAVLYANFEKLVDYLKRSMGTDEASNPRDALDDVVRCFIDFGFQNPDVFVLLRSGPISEAAFAQWRVKMGELSDLIESIIRRGIRQGEMCDPHPELTARFVPGLVRAALIDGAIDHDPELLTQHILRFLQASLLPSEAVGLASESP